MNSKIIWITFLFLFLSCSVFQQEKDSSTVACSRMALSHNQNLVDLINDYRSSHHVQKLFIDTELVSLAAKRAWSISISGDFSHTDPQGNTPMSRLKKYGIVREFIGENLLLIHSEYKFEKKVLETWKQGTKEDKILLSKNYLRFGSGFVMKGKQCIVVSLFTD